MWGSNVMTGRKARKGGSGRALPEETWRISVINALSAVGEANRSFEGFLQERGVNPELWFQATLVFEEALTNVIKYAYEDDREHEIRLEARITGSSFCLQVTDDGRSFNPLSLPPPDLDLPLEERPVGGLGVHLMRKFTESIQYERKKGHNIVTLIFRTNPNH